MVLLEHYLCHSCQKTVLRRNTLRKKGDKRRYEYKKGQAAYIARLAFWRSISTEKVGKGGTRSAIRLQIIEQRQLAYFRRCGKGRLERRLLLVEFRRGFYHIDLLSA